jgi:hypothetical protein
MLRLMRSPPIFRVSTRLTDTSDGDDVENSVSSDGDDNGGDENGGGGGVDGGDAYDEGGDG